MSTNRDRIEQEAMNLLQRGQAGKALDYYLALLRHDPRDLRIRKKVAEVYLQIGRVSEAEKHLRELADALVGSGQHRAAISVLKQLVEMRPEDADLWDKLGDCYQKSNFPGDARDAWEAAIRLLGTVNTTRSLACARKVAGLASSDVAAQVRVAELLERNGDTVGAASFWTDLASESRRRGNAAETARFYERALALAPDDLSALLGAADARLQMSDGRAALQHLQVAYRADQHAIETLTLLARAFEVLGQQPKARQVWLQAARIHEENGSAVDRADALRSALRCGPEDEALLAELGAADRAAEPFRLRLDRCDWAAPATPAEIKVVVRAQVMARYGFIERAAETLRDAGPHLGNATPILVALAELLAEHGDAEAAADTLRKIKAPTSEAAEQIAMRRRVLSGGEAPAVASLETTSDEIIDDEDDAELGPMSSLPPRKAAAPDLPEVEPDSDADFQAVPAASEGEEDADPSEDTAAAAAEAEVRADRLAESGDRDGAIAAYREVLGFDPGNERALVRIGELMAWDDASSEPGEPSPETPPPPVGTLDEELSFGSGLFGGPGEGTFAEIDPARFTIEDELELLEHESFEARARFEVGLFDEAVALLIGLEDLHSRTLAARATAPLEGAAAAAELLAEVVDGADPDSPGYSEALWVLSGLLVETGKITEARSVLEELLEVAPDHRTVERAARERGIELLLER